MISDGERMCLITGLIDVFLTLSVSEIQEGLNKFSLLSGTQVSRYLYVLRKLGLIDRIEHSNQCGISRANRLSNGALSQLALVKRRRNGSATFATNTSAYRIRIPDQKAFWRAESGDGTTHRR